MTKTTFAQIALGVIVIVPSVISIDKARWEEYPSIEPAIGPDGIPSIIVNTLPPNDPVSALVTMTAGLATAGFAVIQRKKLRVPWYFVVFGLMAGIASAILSLVIISDPWVTGNIFFLSYMTCALGFAVSALGVIQYKRA
ncbi:MAG: putative membrane protein [Dehalococcoides mccartyi]|uniref:hypothetical protein n=1 Tax=Dehalococcoides mccartyi TaxID=61435 RepID=UPI000804A481|nr:hypothetical protein [Dehalococcoides mccartyi]MCF7635014.1 putative membrane protein [Dehalococcoides mccartyi]MEA2122970.1 hypothetical protein [Dehalococcoides mccartyi]OBW60909.1 MAG: hypothetical protein A9181_06395 [Dehalococcoides mccartyi]